MEENYSSQSGEFGTKKLPNSTTSLVLGISSIVTCCCFAPVGLILGIIGFVMGNKDKALYEADPALWDEKSWKNAKAGRIISLIGIILSVLGSLGLVYNLVTYGTISGDPEALQQFQEMLGQ